MIRLRILGLTPLLQDHRLGSYCEIMQSGAAEIVEKNEHRDVRLEEISFDVAAASSGPLVEICLAQFKPFRASICSTRMSSRNCR